MQKYPGKLIVLEGPDHAGKTTQHERIAKFFEEHGFEVVRTREPGGTPFAERIRELCKLPLTGEVKDPTTELLLNFAARNQLVEGVIKPALHRGAVVITDRFTLSSLVYQVMVGKAPHELYQLLERKVVLEPMLGRDADLTLIFNVTAETALARYMNRYERVGSIPDHFDDKAESFKAKIRKHYADIAAAATEKGLTEMVGIDGNVSEEQVFAQILPHLMALVNDSKKRPEPTPAFSVRVGGVTIDASSPKDQFRASVVYQDGTVLHVTSIDDNDRVSLDKDSYGVVTHVKLANYVDDIVRCLDMKQRDGISVISVHAFPFTEDAPIYDVSAERTLRI